MATRLILDRNFWITLCSGVMFLLHQLFEVYLPSIFNNYLDDFLFFPVIFGLALGLQRFLHKQQISNWFWFALAVGIAVLVEEGYSNYSASFTHDFYDYMFYGLGFIIFLFQKKKPNTPSLHDQN